MEDYISDENDFDVKYHMYHTSAQIAEAEKRQVMCRSTGHWHYSKLRRFYTYLKLRFIVHWQYLRLS